MPAKRRANSAINYLLTPADNRPVAPVCAVFGDELYLKREVLRALRHDVLGDDESVGPTTFEGDVAELKDVRDALASLSLFGDGRRLVIVEDADSFVTNFRGELEEYANRPHRNAVLALEVKSWQVNTRLAKIVAQHGLAIDCKSPDKGALRRWLTGRAEVEHGVELRSGGVEVLLELLPWELGILDQELAKLAVLAGEDGVIDGQLIRDHVGGWRSRTTWEMIDAATAGKADVALAQLDRLIAAGEVPIALLAQMGSQLRKFATATKLIETAEAQGKRLAVGSAIARAGIPKFKLAEAESQLKQIGRARAKQLTDWLLAADLAMKSHNSSPPRARRELERLIVRLARKSDRRRAAAGISS